MEILFRNRKYINKCNNNLRKIKKKHNKSLYLRADYMAFN